MNGDLIRGHAGRLFESMPQGFGCRTLLSVHYRFNSRLSRTCSLIRVVALSLLAMMLV